MDKFGLKWRISLYHRYLFYFFTCSNFKDIIRYEREGIPFQSLKIRQSGEINFIDAGETLTIFNDIWFHKLYTRYFQSIEPRVVVDIGANIGIFTLFVKKLWPSCVVHAFEPESANFRILQQNIRSSQIHNTFAYNRAVADKNGLQRLFIKDNPGWHSLLHLAADKEQMTADVQCVDLGSVISIAGGYIDFLKVDCEGCEWLFLTDQDQLLKDHIGHVAVEYHEISDQKLEDLLTLFKQAGFTCQTTYPDKWQCGMLYAQRHR